MYVGHFAIGVALKARFPEVPALPIVMGIGVLDIIDGAFILAGINQVTANLSSGPSLFFDLTFIDWDHSLLMAVVWSLLWGALFLRDKRVAAVAAVAAFSHFVADLPMHDADLALYPHSAVHFGLGLWPRLGTGSWLLEGAFAAALVAWAWQRCAKRGQSLLWPAVLLLVLFLNLSPWTSPMKFAAGLTEPAAHLLHGIIVIAGFILPNALLLRLLRVPSQPLEPAP